MKALILDGALTLRDLADAVGSAMKAELVARDYVVARRDLTALAIPECKGDFGCWTVTPGACVQPGPHREVAAEIIRSDLVVLITDVTFGGYSSALKRQLDHCIPLISPWMTTLDGETHHVPRYARFPDFLVLGLMEGPDAKVARVFERLAQRNALNMHAPRSLSPVLTRAELPQLAGWIKRTLDDLAASGPPMVAAAPVSFVADSNLAIPAAARRALLLVGSPRGGQSVSAAIVAYFNELLTSRGLMVGVEWIGVRPSEQSVRALEAKIAEAEVVGLATPLYVDSLPAPVTEARDAGPGTGEGVVTPPASRHRQLWVPGGGSHGHGARDLPTLRAASALRLDRWPRCWRWRHAGGKAARRTGWPGARDHTGSRPHRRSHRTGQNRPGGSTASRPAFTHPGVALSPPRGPGLPEGGEEAPSARPCQFAALP